MQSPVLCLILTNRAARHLVNILGNDKRSLSRDAAMEKARTLLRNLVSIGEEKTCFVCRFEPASSKDTRDIFEIHFPQRRLSLRGVPGDTPKQFVIISAALNRRMAATQTAWNQEVVLHFYDQATMPSFVGGLADDFWEKIKQLPFPHEYQSTIYNRVEDWETYLKITEALAEQKAYSLVFNCFHISEDGLTMRLDLDDWPQGLTDKLKGSLNDRFDIVLSENRVPMGILINFNQSRGQIELELDDAFADALHRGRFKFPDTSKLYYSSFGEVVEINRQKNAMDRLAKGQAKNANLGKILFDLENYLGSTENDRHDPGKYVFQNQKLDDYQKEAIIGALNAEDFYLIKGPPGTGKTTVIAELCAQAVMRGKRVLVSSQANLAVDNVLAKFIGSTNIRPIRFGNEASIDGETLPLHPTNVVSHWLDNIQRRCSSDWDDYYSTADKIAELDKHFAFAKRYFNILQDVESPRSELKEALGKQAAQKRIIEDLKAEKAGFESNLSEIGLIGSLFIEGDYEGLREKLQKKEAYTLPQDDISTSFKRKVEALSGELNSLSFIKDPGYHHGTNWSLLVKALDLQIWYEKHRLPLVTALRESEQFVGKISAFSAKLVQYTQVQSEEKPLEIALQRAKNGKYRLFEEIQRQTTIVQQLENLKNDGIDFAQWRQLSKKAQGAHRSALAYFPAIQQLDKPVQGELLVELGSKTKLLMDKTIEAEMALFWLDQCLHYIKFGVTQLEQGVARIESHLRGKAEFPIQGGNESSLRTFAERTGIEQIRVDAPDPGVVQNVVNRITVLVKEYSGDGVAAAVGQLGQLMFDSARSLFGGPSVAVSRTMRRSTQLAVLRAGLVPMQDLSRNWQRQLNYEMASFRKMEAEATDAFNRLLDRTIDRLIAKHNSIRSDLSRSLNSQNQKIEELEWKKQKWAEAFRKVVNKLQKEKRLLDAVLDAAPFIQTLPSFRECAAAFKNCEFHKVDDAIISDWRLLLNRNMALLEDFLDFPVKEFLDHVLEHTRFKFQGLVQEIDGSLQSAFNTVEAVEVEVKVLTRKIKESEDKLKRLREKWQSMHARLYALLGWPEPAAGDIHAPGYLQVLVQQYPQTMDELHDIQKNMAPAEDFAKEWLDALKRRSYFEERQLSGFYLENSNVVGATCSLTAREDFSDYGSFDYVVVDEVSKATPPELLLPLLHGKKIVLVGDDRQLPPMIGYEVLAELAEELGTPQDELQYIMKSLFAQLWNDTSSGYKTMLKKQYRMHSSILEVVNQFYDYELEHGDLSLDKKRHHGCGGEIFSDYNNVVWVDVPQFKDYEEERVGTSYVNVTEIKILQRALKELNASWGEGNQPKEVGIITFYGAQERRIRQMISRGDYPNLKIKIGTVDRFQGMEYPIVIISMVRNNSFGNVGHARVPERVNVAMSRAQELLILIGCGSLFCESAQRDATKIYSNIRTTIAGQGGMTDVHRFLMD
ncbi:MAG: AAA family ATPase [Firmicutes bacterium]|nr:AAA family ATPase [Bacillota bacterium]